MRTRSPQISFNVPSLGHIGGYGTLENMDFANPNPAQRVDDAQRDRAVDYLQQAYACGAIEEELFEARLGDALAATTRAELNASLRGIAREAAPLLGRRAPTAQPPALKRAENVAAGFTHLAGLVTIFVGPAVVKATANPGSRLWWEAGRAMSYQLTSMLIGVPAIVTAIITGSGGWVVFGAYMFYLVLTLVFAARAFNGENSTGMIGRILPFKPVKPDQRRELDR